ncbi:competence protein [Bacillus safensis FO-36b]|uniref:competence protein CoiA n=1 Tax=Bacillus safensis TaxID=561879 RepID=UPI00045C6090|nr:competence protein CoiA family protein [Bacillus safensis]AWI36242.1 competence protein [Bacillus safensis FO-36b]KDE27113.1 competence protein [Bacillus safensis FO-36b]MCM3047657.1 competence protein [Bacillus safensis]MEC1048214.1 competence protein CoiA family protein [Bacillus safensis]
MNAAIMDNGKLIRMTHHLSKSRLEHVRTTCKFYCTECREEVQLKLGEHRVYHFAHKQLTACPLASGETAYHQAGKEAIMNWLKGLGHKPALEKYMSNIHQRPDVTVSIGNENYAIEFQCANISRQELRRRTAGLREAGLFPIWMIGANRLNRKSAQLFSFSSIHWGILRESEERRLIFFCPIQKRFIHLDQFLVFQPTKICAAMTVRPPSAYRDIPALLSLPSSKRQVNQQWIKCIQQFRQRPPRSLSNESKRLRNIFYEHHQTAFPFLPTELFIPVQEAYIFTSPVYVWQGCLYDWMMRKKGSGRVTIQQLMMEINRCVQMKEVKLRYGDVSREEIKEVVTAYVNALVRQGFLHMTKEGNYEVSSNQMPIRTLDEVLKRDAFLFH